MRLWPLSLLLLVACQEARAPSRAQSGVELGDVHLTTWRGSALTARGTAQAVTLTSEGFAAQTVTVTTPSGATVRAPSVSGDLALSHVTAERLSAATASGCQGWADEPVHYDVTTVESVGPVRARGCGFSLDGQRLIYSVLERRADIEGPVRTRIEAQP